ARARAHDPDANMGEGRHRYLDRGSRVDRGPHAAPSNAPGPSPGRAHDGEGRVAVAPTVCGGRGCPWNCTPRLSSHLREVVPRRQWRTGADPVAARPCVGPDHRAVPRHETGSGSRAERWDKVEGRGVGGILRCGLPTCRAISRLGVITPGTLPRSFPATQNALIWMVTKG